jgi:hypothetical protein
MARTARRFMDTVSRLEMTESSPRPTTWVQNRRTKKWIELPDEIPGLATGWVRQNNKRVPAEVPIEGIEYWARFHMTQHDNLCPEDRWKEKHLGQSTKGLVDLTTPPRWTGRRRGTQAKIGNLIDLI